MHLFHCCSKQLIFITALLVLLCHLSFSAVVQQRQIVEEPHPIPTPNCMVKWLEDIGIDQSLAQSYAAIFRNQSIDEQILKLLTIEQLGEAGISKYGHRVLIYNCINEAGGDCNSRLCGVGGSCNLFPDASFQCVCRSGFAGDYCEKVVDRCASYPCLNGGTCEEDGESSLCLCPPKFTGDRCQHDYCYTQPCQNGGTCISHTNGYNCSCPHGTEGRHCETVWLSPEDYTLFKEEFAQLSSQLTTLQRVVGDNKLDSINAFTDALDTAFAAQGPRFFKDWLEIEHGSISQVIHFYMDSRQFFGAVNSNSRHEHYGVIIYEIINDSLTHIQTLRMSSPVSIRPFHIGSQTNKEYFIATANFYNMSLQRIKSKLYKWNGKEFVELQEFATNGAKDVDFVTIENVGSFLAFSCHHDKQSFDTPSLVYVWDSINGLFVYYQTLPTTGAQKLHFFNANQETYLAVANQFDGTGNGMTNSMVFRWNGTHFDQRAFQEIPTQGAHDLHPFVIGCHVFLVAANSFDGRSHNIMSKVYRLESDSFVEHAEIQTRGAVAVEPFTIRSEHFLAVINSHDELTGSANTASVIYKIDGPNFVPFQEIMTKKGSYAHFFTLQNGCKALAVSNETAKPKIYKWTFVSLKKACCM